MDELVYYLVKIDIDKTIAPISQKGKHTFGISTTIESNPLGVSYKPCHCVLEEDDKRLFWSMEFYYLSNALECIGIISNSIDRNDVKSVEEFVKNEYNLRMALNKKEQFKKEVKELYEPFKPKKIDNNNYEATEDTNINN